MCLDVSNVPNHALFSSRLCIITDATKTHAWIVTHHLENSCGYVFSSIYTFISKMSLPENLHKTYIIRDEVSALSTFRIQCVVYAHRLRFLLVISCLRFNYLSSLILFVRF